MVRKPLVKNGFFFSYASEDKASFAGQLFRALEDRDATVSADFRTVKAGKKFARQILGSLRKNQYTVLCITEAYLRKYLLKESMIKREVQLAISLSMQDPRRGILPVRKGVDVQSIAQVIPELARINIVQVNPDDDGLRDAANKILFNCGLDTSASVETKKITVRTSYATYLRAVEAASGVPEDVRWAADQRTSTEGFTVEYLPQLDETSYQQVRLRHDATGLYLAQAADPAISLLVAQREVGPLTTFTTYTSEGALQLRCQNGKMVDMEPDTGHSMLCADAERRADAAGFIFLSHRNAAVAATALASGSTLAVVARNWMGHFGVRFRERGRWLRWASLPQPRSTIERVALVGGEQSVLVFVGTSDSVVSACVISGEGLSTSASAWRPLPQVKPGEINAVYRSAGKWFLVACLSGKLVAAEWNGTRASIPWRKIVNGSFHAAVLLERLDNDTVIVAKRDDQIVAVNMATRMQTLIDAETSVAADIRHAALVSTDAAHLMLVAVDSRTQQGYCVEFSAGDSPVLQPMNLLLHGNVHLLRIGHRQLVLVATNKDQAAICLYWQDGTWSAVSNLGGIWLSALAACRDELNGVRVFGEGLDGVIFTKHFDGTVWPDTWSRIKAPPPRNSE